MQRVREIAQGCPEFAGDALVQSHIGDADYVSVDRFAVAVGSNDRADLETRLRRTNLFR